VGEYLYLERASFAIPVAKAAEALRVLKPFHDDITNAPVKTIGDVFASLAWPLKKQGDAWVMPTAGKPSCKMGWQEQLFELAAPFVADGSFIVAHGEGGPFAWYFVGGRVQDEEPNTDRIGTVRITVPVASLRPAFVELERALPKLLKRLDDPVSVTAVFDRLHWKTERTADGSLRVVRKLGAEPRLTSRDQRVLEALARFVATDSIVEGVDAEWRLVFENGACERRTG